MEVKIRSGDVKLDFTQAEVTWPILQIDAEVRSGNLTLITKPGIVVDIDDVAVRSGNVKVKAPWGDSVPANVRTAADGVRTKMLKEGFNPFVGEIKDVSGKVKVAKGEKMDDMTLYNWNWAVEGVTGLAT